MKTSIQTNIHHKIISIYKNIINSARDKNNGKEIIDLIEEELLN